jgi:AraC-like DNA-binding protein
MSLRNVSCLKRRDYFLNSRRRVVVHRQIPQRPMAQHRHEFFEVVIILSGSGVHITGDFRHQIETRDVLVLNSRRAHGYEQTENLNLVNILIRDDLLARLGRELGGLPGYHALFTLEPARWLRRSYASYLRVGGDELRQIEDWANRLEEETQQSRQGGALLAEAYLTLIVGLLCRRYGKKGGSALKRESCFGRILSWIEGASNRPLSVADLAREAGMSERTFYRRFRAAVGMTPAAYLMQTRIRRAAEQLDRNDGEERRIGEVATACGFDDGNYFSRCFRNVMGRSPREYRKSQSSHTNPKSLAY